MLRVQRRLKGVSHAGARYQVCGLLSAAIPSRLECRMDARINGKRQMGVFSDPIDYRLDDKAMLTLPFISNKISVKSS